MKQFILYFLIAIFSVFVGCQITEGVLLVPYWQSMSSADFYSYYNKFGPSIGLFFTIFTIIAALIPISLTIYFKRINSKAFGLALISSFLSIVFVSFFYVYFKDANALFYQSSLSDEDLKKELILWSYWHWGRIVVELLSLLFIIFSLIKFQKNRS